MNSKKAALDAAKEQRDSLADKEFELPYGMKGRVLPVAARLLDEVTSRIKDPEPPLVTLEGKDKPEANPFDPSYIKAKNEAETARGSAGMDALIMFGLELTTPIATDGWLGKLKMMERLGQMDLSMYDLADSLDLEYVYKRYIASTAEILTAIGAVSGLSQEGIAAAESSFQGDAAR